ncbi:hypothetical protein [Methylotuvimicrobium buryatense]|uniref:Uncharacterized protein n=1 Tax=Methylotuvimicrobium buryatense TaxID=95641 RepID=A0A4P9ULB1_METBY|nr:hypothetical protein [Methylotuvimicrobium buryatense]QCW81887.1 hypothetical protein EQU24_06205 [Methylotuvimicrobium buryatense]
MALRRVAMPCILPPPALFAQTPAKHPALRLSGTKNLHFANAPFPRFSASVTTDKVGESLDHYQLTAGDVALLD